MIYYIVLSTSTTREWTTHSLSIYLPTYVDKWVPSGSRKMA